jgi:serine/threonine protein kinase
MSYKLMRSAIIVRVRTVNCVCVFAAVVFVYDYHPGAETLRARFFLPNSGKYALNETTIWSFVIQMAGALKTIHSAGLAARTIDPTKILVRVDELGTGTGNSRKTPQGSYSKTAVVGHRMLETIYYI